MLRKSLIIVAIAGAMFVARAEAGTNQPPVVTDIGGYMEPADCCTITLTAEAYDPNPEDVVEQAEFQVYYEGDWRVSMTDDDGEPLYVP